MTVTNFTSNNVLLANGTTTSINGTPSGTLTYNGTVLNTSAITTTSTTSNQVGGVTLNNGAVSGITTLGCGAITSSGALGLSANGITSGTHVPATNNTYDLGTATTGLWANVYATTFTGNVTGNLTGNVNGNVTGNVTGNCSGTAGGLSGTPNITVGTIGCGAITSSGALGLSTNSITSGTHFPATNNTYNLGSSGTGLWANVYATTFTGALTGNVTGNCSGTAGGLSGTPNITVGTIGCGAITSSGALGLSANGITSGTHVPATNNTYNLGTATTGLWANVYATTFTGALTGNVTGNCSGSSGSCTGNAATATNFSGTPNITVGTISSTTHTITSGGLNMCNTSGSNINTLYSAGASFNFYPSTGSYGYRTYVTGQQGAGFTTLTVTFPNGTFYANMCVYQPSTGNYYMANFWYNPFTGAPAQINPGYASIAATQGTWTANITGLNASFTTRWNYQAGIAV